MSATSGPHSIAVAVTAKNIPPECFLDAATVLKEIIYPEWDFISEITAFTKVGAVFLLVPFSKVRREGERRTQNAERPLREGGVETNNQLKLQVGGSVAE